MVATLTPLQIFTACYILIYFNIFYSLCDLDCFGMIFGYSWGLPGPTSPTRCPRCPLFAAQVCDPNQSDEAEPERDVLDPARPGSGISGIGGCEKGGKFPGQLTACTW